MNKLKDFFANIFAETPPVKLVFSAKRRKSLAYSRVTMRPVAVAGTLAYQAEYVFANKVTHENIAATQAAEFCFALMDRDFKQAHVFTKEREIQILANKIDNPRISSKASALSAPAVSLAHNREKNYIIPDGQPCDFLIRLGVMGADGRVFPKHYSKFRQINRFLEIVDDVFPALTDAAEAQTSQRPLRIIDFGCGKAYLTFALYYYLRLQKQLAVEITGLDLKADVIAFCSKVAQELGYDGLNFLRGDIADYTSDHADMVVTLHACDTATDYALINAVSWNTRVILSVPCCQHELFRQIRNELHQPLLKHGILKDRLTEYLTDGLRGLKLESRGYDVDMIEFTSLEHTARNIMIRAVKRFDAGSARAAKAEAQYRALCDFYHVTPTIEKM